MSKKLLLADDSITIQKVIGITFANEDYELSVVDNGEAALETARKVLPDLILADVFMPGKNGYELCAAVKKDPALAGIPLLLLTGTFEPFDENKAKAAGADSWIAKPFESQALIDRVEELLARPPQPAIILDVPASTPALQPTAVAPAAAAPVQPAAAPPVPAPSPIMEPAAEDDIWGDEPLEAGMQETAASPAAGDWQTAGSADDDLWGGFALEEESLGETAAAVATPSNAFDVAIDGEWGDLAEEIPPVSVPEAAPQVENTILYAGQRPVAAPAVVEPVPAAGSGWEEFDDEILSLDEVDILEEEDLVEAPATDTIAQAAGSPAMDAEPEIFDPFAEDDAPQMAEPAWDAVAEPPVAPAWNDIATESAASAEPAWELTDDEEPGWEEPVAEEKKEAPFESGWDLELDDTPAAAAAVPEPISAPAAPAVAPAPVAPVTPAAPAPLSPATVEAQVGSLSEEDIARIVEKVAGAVIERLAGSVLEKVVWEVVPDLAEAMIRDEIRTIKEGIR